MDQYDTSESSQERTFGSFDWLFGESPSTEAHESESFEVSDPLEPIWTTVRGDKIPLSKMETRHICNCIKLLESKSMYKHKWYQIFKDELTRRRASKLKVSFSL